MSTFIYILVAALVLAFGTVAFMSATLEGIGKTLTFAEAIRDPSAWLLFSIATAGWFGVGMVGYGIVAGLKAIAGYF